MESNNSTLFQQIRDVFFNDAYKTIDEKEVYALVTNVRRSLSIETTENPPYKEAIDSGFVPLIISALKKDKCITDLLKLELVWILTSLFFFSFLMYTTFSIFKVLCPLSFRHFIFKGCEVSFR